MSIKAHKQTIAATLAADATLIAHDAQVYNYRDLPGDYPLELNVSYIGGTPDPVRSLNGQTEQPGYSYAITIALAHDATAAGRKTADDALDDIEDAIHAALDQLQHTDQWRKLVFYRDSIRPPSPASLQHTRLAQLYVRIYPA